MTLLAFAASHRENSLNRALLQIALEMVARHSPDVVIDHQAYDALDMPLFNDAQREAEGVPAEVQAISTYFNRAESLMIAMPEYNWGYPGSLKNIIDWLSCCKPNPLTGKPIFLMCATPSDQGGIVGLQALKSMLGGWLGMHVYPHTYSLPLAHQCLREDGFAESGKGKLLETQLAQFADYCTKWVP